MPIKITKLDESDIAVLYVHYGSQTSPQDCFLVLDCEAETLAADTDPEISGGIPASVYCRRTLRFPIPILTASAANALMDEVLPLAERVVAGYESTWGGRQYVGTYTMDADEAIEALTKRCSPENADWDTADYVQEFTASDFYADDDRATLIASSAITGGTPDEELDRIAAVEIANAATISSQYGYIVLTDVLDYLKDLRDELRG